MSNRSEVPQSSTRKRKSPKGSAVRRTTPALTVWIYDTALGAAAGEVRLRNLRARDVIEVHDAVTVSWMPGSHQPRIGHLWHETSAAAARNSALGRLVRLIFLDRTVGAATNGDLSALATRLRTTGIDRTFLEELRAHLRPESSALLVLSGDADLDQVRPVIERGLARGDVILMYAQLPDGAPDVLRDAVREIHGHGDGV